MARRAELIEAGLMLLPRMTTRRWMIAVAVAAVLLWTGLRADALHSQAIMHVKERQSCLKMARVYEAVYRVRKESGWCACARELRPEDEANFAEVPKLRQRAEWHDAMEAKYERAARRPWLPVSPDPAEPQ